MSNERVQYKQNWTDHEKEDALRCFQWYGNSFNYIADVMGNKTVEQIEEFYAENRELVDTVKKQFDDGYKSQLSIKQVP
uniref:SANT domain-containing protein n=1 Tax=Caenorhabditis japonica TaxID=281687 RepID=A0A8R1E8D0_CAEJA